MFQSFRNSEPSNLDFKEIIESSLKMNYTKFSNQPYIEFLLKNKNCKDFLDMLSKCVAKSYENPPYWFEFIKNTYERKIIDLSKNILFDSFSQYLMDQFRLASTQNASQAQRDINYSNLYLSSIIKEKKWDCIWTKYDFPKKFELIEKTFEEWMKNLLVPDKSKIKSSLYPNDKVIDVEEQTSLQVSKLPQIDQGKNKDFINLPGVPINVQVQNQINEIITLTNPAAFILNPPIAVIQNVQLQQANLLNTNINNSNQQPKTNGQAVLPFKSNLFDNNSNNPLANNRNNSSALSSLEKMASLAQKITYTNNQDRSKLQPNNIKLVQDPPKKIIGSVSKPSSPQESKEPSQAKKISEPDAQKNDKKSFFEQKSNDKAPNVEKQKQASPPNNSTASASEKGESKASEFNPKNHSIIDFKKFHKKFLEINIEKKNIKYYDHEKRHIRIEKTLEKEDILWRYYLECSDEEVANEALEMFRSLIFKSSQTFLLHSPEYHKTYFTVIILHFKDITKAQDTLRAKRIFKLLSEFLKTFEPSTDIKRIPSKRISNNPLNKVKLSIPSGTKDHFFEFDLNTKIWEAKQYFCECLSKPEEDYDLDIDGNVFRYEREEISLQSANVKLGKCNLVLKREFSPEQLDFYSNQSYLDAYLEFHEFFSNKTDLGLDFKQIFLNFCRGYAINLKKAKNLSTFFTQNFGSKMTRDRYNFVILILYYLLSYSELCNTEPDIWNSKQEFQEFYDSVLVPSLKDQNIGNQILEYKRKLERDSSGFHPTKELVIMETFFMGAEKIDNFFSFFDSYDLMKFVALELTKFSPKICLYAKNKKWVREFPTGIGKIVRLFQKGLKIILKNLNIITSVQKDMHPNFFEQKEFKDFFEEFYLSGEIFDNIVSQNFEDPFLAFFDEIQQIDGYKTLISPILSKIFAEYIPNSLNENKTSLIILASSIYKKNSLKRDEGYEVDNFYSTIKCLVNYLSIQNENYELKSFSQTKSILDFLCIYFNNNESQINHFGFEKFKLTETILNLFTKNSFFGNKACLNSFYQILNILTQRAKNLEKFMQHMAVFYKYFENKPYYFEKVSFKKDFRPRKNYFEDDKTGSSLVNIIRFLGSVSTLAHNLADFEHSSTNIKAPEDNIVFIIKKTMFKAINKRAFPSSPDSLIRVDTNLPQNSSNQHSVWNYFFDLLDSSIQFSSIENIIKDHLASAQITEIVCKNCFHPEVKTENVKLIIVESVPNRSLNDLVQQHMKWKITEENVCPKCSQKSQFMSRISFRETAPYLIFSTPNSSEYFHSFPLEFTSENFFHIDSDVTYELFALAYTSDIGSTSQGFIIKKGGDDATEWNLYKDSQVFEFETKNLSQFSLLNSGNLMKSGFVIYQKKKVAKYLNTYIHSISLEEEKPNEEKSRDMGRDSKFKSWKAEFMNKLAMENMLSNAIEGDYVKLLANMFHNSPLEYLKSNIIKFILDSYLKIGLFLKQEDQTTLFDIISNKIQEEESFCQEFLDSIIQSSFIETNLLRSKSEAYKLQIYELFTFSFKKVHEYCGEKKTEEIMEITLNSLSVLGQEDVQFKYVFMILTQIIKINHRYMYQLIAKQLVGRLMTIFFPENLYQEYWNFSGENDCTYPMTKKNKNDLSKLFVLLKEYFSRSALNLDNFIQKNNETDEKYEIDPKDIASMKFYEHQIHKYRHSILIEDKEAVESLCCIISLFQKRYRNDIFIYITKSIEKEPYLTYFLKTLILQVLSRRDNNYVSFACKILESIFQKIRNTNSCSFTKYVSLIIGIFANNHSENNVIVEKSIQNFQYVMERMQEELKDSYEKKQLLSKFKSIIKNHTSKNSEDPDHSSLEEQVAQKNEFQRNDKVNFYDQKSENWIKGTISSVYEFIVKVKSSQIPTGDKSEENFYFFESNSAFLRKDNEEIS